MALLIWYAAILASRMQPRIEKPNRSVFLCVMTVFVLACTSQDVGSAFSDSRATAKTIVSGSLLMVLGMTLAAFMYRCKQITRKLF
jgi:hypothetical protein